MLHTAWVPQNPGTDCREMNASELTSECPSDSANSQAHSGTAELFPPHSGRRGAGESSFQIGGWGREGQQCLSDLYQQLYLNCVTNLRGVCVTLKIRTLCIPSQCWTTELHPYTSSGIPIPLWKDHIYVSEGWLQHVCSF